MFCKSVRICPFVSCPIFSHTRLLISEQVNFTPTDFNIWVAKVATWVGKTYVFGVSPHRSLLSNVGRTSDRYCTKVGVNHVGRDMYSAPYVLKTTNHRITLVQTTTHTHTHTHTNTLAAWCLDIYKKRHKPCVFVLVKDDRETALAFE